MRYEYRDNKLSSVFGITDDYHRDAASFQQGNSSNKLLWNRNQRAVCIFVDGVEVILEPNQISSVTFYHHLDFCETELPITAILFNKAFYCTIDHDAEVSCNGILFFGSQDLPIISIPPTHKRKFDLLWEVVKEEFSHQDNIQGEMLLMLLKRLIILCTRLAKDQLIVKSLNISQIETIRQFNFLVDIHFREKHKVKDYAELLFKSPKTLSNLFAMNNQKSPQQVIQDRIVLEAKRLMQFTDKQTQEIAFELGFEDPAYFSRYFKKVAKISPSQFAATKKVA